MFKYFKIKKLLNNTYKIICNEQITYSEFRNASRKNFILSELEIKTDNHFIKIQSLFGITFCQNIILLDNKIIMSNRYSNFVQNFIDKILFQFSNKINKIYL